MNRETEFYNSLVVLDTEATSRVPTEAEVIEFAVHFPRFGNDYSEFFITRDGDIPYEVQAITHITPKMIADSQTFDEGKAVVQDLLNAMPVAVAQNIWYDKTLLEQYGVTHPKWLCTMRLAKRLFLDDDTFTQYNLSYLRYRLHADMPATTDTHRALADVKVTVAVLRKLVDEMKSRNLLDDYSEWADQIIEYINKPLRVKRMPFGKHKGKLLKEIPLDYWSWAMKNLDSLNEDCDNYDEDFADSVANAIEAQL